MSVKRPKRQTSHKFDFDPLGKSVFPLPKHEWTPNNKASKCMACNKPFSKVLFKSGKHHCRKCGNVICKDCFNHELRGQPVCTPCYIKFGKYASFTNFYSSRSVDDINTDDSDNHSNNKRHKKRKKDENKDSSPNTAQLTTNAVSDQTTYKSHRNDTNDTTKNVSKDDTQLKIHNYDSANSNESDIDSDASDISSDEDSSQFDDNSDQSRRLMYGYRSESEYDENDYASDETEDENEKENEKNQLNGQINQNNNETSAQTTQTTQNSDKNTKNNTKTVENIAKNSDQITLDLANNAANNVANIANTSNNDLEELSKTPHAPIIDPGADYGPPPQTAPKTDETPLLLIQNNATPSISAVSGSGSGGGSGSASPLHLPPKPGLHATYGVSSNGSHSSYASHVSRPVSVASSFDGNNTLFFAGINDSISHFDSIADFEDTPFTNHSYDTHDTHDTHDTQYTTGNSKFDEKESEFDEHRDLTPFRFGAANGYNSNNLSRSEIVINNGDINHDNNDNDTNDNNNHYKHSDRGLRVNLSFDTPMSNGVKSNKTSHKNGFLSHLDVPSAGNSINNGTTSQIALHFGRMKSNSTYYNSSFNNGSNNYSNYYNRQFARMGNDDAMNIKETVELLKNNVEKLSNYVKIIENDSENDKNSDNNDQNDENNENNENNENSNETKSENDTNMKETEDTQHNNENRLENDAATECKDNESTQKNKDTSTTDVAGSPGNALETEAKTSENELNDENTRKMNENNEKNSKISKKMRIYAKLANREKKLLSLCNKLVKVAYNERNTLKNEIKGFKTNERDLIERIDNLGNEYESALSLITKKEGSIYALEQENASLLEQIHTVQHLIDPTQSNEPSVADNIHNIHNMGDVDGMEAGMNEMEGIEANNSLNRTNDSDFASDNTESELDNLIDSYKKYENMIKQQVLSMETKNGEVRENAESNGTDSADTATKSLESNFSEFQRLFTAILSKTQQNGEMRGFMNCSSSALMKRGHRRRKTQKVDTSFSDLLGNGMSQEGIYYEKLSALRYEVKSMRDWILNSKKEMKSLNIMVSKSFFSMKRELDTLCEMEEDFNYNKLKFNKKLRDDKYYFNEKESNMNKKELLLNEKLYKLENRANKLEMIESDLNKKYEKYERLVREFENKQKEFNSYKIDKELEIAMSYNNKMSEIETIKTKLHNKEIQLKNENDKLMLKLELFKKEKEMLHQSQQQLISEEKNLNQQIKFLDVDSSGYAQLQSEYKAQTKKYINEQLMLKNKINKLEIEVKRLGIDNNSLQNELDSNKQEIITLQKNYNECKNELTNELNNKNVNLKKISNLECELKESKETIDNNGELIKTLNENITNIENENLSKINEINNEKMKLTNENNDINEKLTQLNEKLKEMKQENKQIRVKLKKFEKNDKLKTKSSKTGTSGRGSKRNIGAGVSSNRRNGINSSNRLSAARRK